MKAFLTEVSETKKYVVITTYDSANRKQAELKVPKYFMGEAKGVEVGDEVEIAIRKKKRGKKR